MNATSFNNRYLTRCRMRNASLSLYAETLNLETLLVYLLTVVDLFSVPVDLLLHLLHLPGH